MLAISAYYGAMVCVVRSLMVFFFLGGLLFPPVVRADVQVSGFIDFSFGSWGGSGGISDDDDLCVHNSVTSNYYLTATGDGPGFSLVKGGDTIDYTVRWNDQTGTTGNIALSSGVQSALQSGANTSSTNCGGGNNANLQVSITEGELSAAVPGAYTGTLTILIEPE
jgi:hypothetical protein